MYSLYGTESEATIVHDKIVVNDVKSFILSYSQIKTAGTKGRKYSHPFSRKEYILIYIGTSMILPYVEQTFAIWLAYATY